MIATVLASTSVIGDASAATYSNGTATATFTVSLVLQGGCTITANALNFTATGPLTSAVNQQSTVGVNCTNTTPYNVGLDAGTVTGSSIATRYMAGTSSGNTGTLVSFQLYQDAAHGTVWGNTQGSNTVGGIGTGAVQSITVYGQVPAQATPQPDTYQTSVTATVYF
ncbi:spore coat U domain-containing protein [Trinickia diaoshuihuensis]|uniref:Csu type fimbrial protein n=1 Tax=Trinickia diaoshuihuensis TaxID=2292265 RepID=UPI001F080B88|nr:spore coat U domain-containing protein [Trinickia diaoshuihuensis]